MWQKAEHMSSAFSPALNGKKENWGRVSHVKFFISFPQKRIVHLDEEIPEKETE